MTRYISDRDIEALAQSGDQYDDLGPEPDEAGLSISFPALAGMTAGVVAAIVVAWVAFDQFSGPGPVPLVTASTDPIKIRPESPGGMDIPFQNMALYDRLEPESEVSAPVLAPLPEQPNRGALEPAPIMQDGEAVQAQTEVTGAIEPPPASPTTFPVTPAQSLADGEGESLFTAAPATTPPITEPTAAPPAAPNTAVSDVPPAAAPPAASDTPPIEIDVTAVTTPVQPVSDVVPVDQADQTAAIPAAPLDGPPIPARHPIRGATVAAVSAPETGVESFFPSAGQVDGDQRRIRRGTIASPQVPLDAAQGGLRPGGALGVTDDSGTLVYRNNVRQETTAPLPSGPVEGDVQLVLQPPAGQPSNVPPALQPPAISVTPQQPTRSADGSIEIRSPNRETIDIRSPNQVAGAAPEPAPTPSLIPQPPSRPVGPASRDDLSDGDQVAAANQPPQPPVRRPLSEVNNLPNEARAPAPISTAITRGTVVNQRAPAPGAPQAPVSETPQTQQSVPAQPTPNLQPTTVSSIPPQLSSNTPSQPSSGEGWRVQLASVGSQEAAMGEWRRFQRANSDLLGNLNLKIQRADLGARGIFYRIQAGVLDRDGANRVCQALKSRGTDCLVTRD